MSGRTVWQMCTSQFNSISVLNLPEKLCNGESVDVDFISPQMWFGVYDNLYTFSVFDM